MSGNRKRLSTLGKTLSIGESGPLLWKIWHLLGRIEMGFFNIKKGGSCNCLRIKKNQIIFW